MSQAPSRCCPAGPDQLWPRTGPWSGIHRRSSVHLGWRWTSRCLPMHRARPCSWYHVVNHVTGEVVPSANILSWRAAVLRPWPVPGPLHRRAWATLMPLLMPGGHVVARTTAACLL